MRKTLKSVESPIRLCSVAQQLLLLSLLGHLRAQGNSLSLSLSTPGLCQPWSSPEPLASYRSTMPLQVRSHGMSTAMGIFAATWLEPALASNSTLLFITHYLSTTLLAPCLSRHGQPAVTLIKMERSYLTNLGEPMPTPATNGVFFTVFFYIHTKETI